MKKSIASFASAIFLLFGGVTGNSAGLNSLGGGENARFDTSLVARLEKFNGAVVSRLSFLGLVRTKEQAARWLMKTTEGQVFDSDQLARDIQALYNTGDLYDVQAQVDWSQTQHGQIDVIITLKDKWTLLPFAGVQGGGGALTYGGGLFDTNLFGYFINGMIQFYNYNGVFSYNVLAYQEYVKGTQTMASTSVSNNVNPTIIYNLDRSSAGNYAWDRQQEEIMVGTHLYGNGQLVRLFFTGDVYTDDMVSNVGVNAFTDNGVQYRFQPRAIFGRANIVEYLENGTELTIHPSAANFFGPVAAYQGLDVNYKYVKILPHGANFGFNIFAGSMSQAPPPYEYQVGGYSNLRGYANSRQTGPYIAVESIEYRPLIYKTRWSPLGIDLDWVVLQGCIFSDAGSAWGDATLTGDPGSQEFRPLWSAGAGVRLNFLHFAGAIMRLDFARTINPDEGWGVSFGVGQFF